MNFFKDHKVYIVLFAIIFLGVLLRTYQFHDWLHFGSDQARDAFVIEKVVEDQASWPLLGPDASNTHFKLGPIYYYFQIVAAKIFGMRIDALAYPDLIFSILAIPLFFIFLKRYFSNQLSLILTSLYAVSFYVVEYSRFAWNPNPIPFFILLFLLALSELLTARKKTAWWWIVLLGVTVGVGVQLHTLLLLILPIMLVGTFVFCVTKGHFDWKQWVIILVVVAALNSGQIKSEMQTGGKNFTYFSAAFTDRSGSGVGRLLQNLELNVLCHAQANTHILSSWRGYGGTCEILSLVSYPKKSGGPLAYGITISIVVLSIAFFITGYGLLIYSVWKEPDERKRYFLGIILAYVSVSFLVMLSIIRGAPLRYFIHVEFVPFILLGLIVQAASRRFPHTLSLWMSTSVFGFLFITNISSFIAEAQTLSDGTRGDSGFVVLDQAEQMVAYMEQSTDGKSAYLWGKDQYVSTYYKSLRYIALQAGFDFVGVDRKGKPGTDMPIFYLSKNEPQKSDSHINGYEVETSEKFGRIMIYKLKNQ